MLKNHWVILRKQHAPVVENVIFDIMKKPISATIDKELIAWIEKEVQNKEKYRNKSHLIEVAIEMLKSNKK